MDVTRWTYLLTKGLSRKSENQNCKLNFSKNCHLEVPRSNPFDCSIFYFLSFTNIFRSRSDLPSQNEGSRRGWLGCAQQQFKSVVPRKGKNAATKTMYQGWLKIKASDFSLFFSYFSIITSMIIIQHIVANTAMEWLERSSIGYFRNVEH